MVKMKIQILAMMELILIYYFPMQHLDKSNKGFMGHFQYEFTYQLPTYWLRTLELPHIFVLTLIISSGTLFLSRFILKNKINLIEVVIFNGYLIFLTYPVLEILRRDISSIYVGVRSEFEIYFTTYFWVCWLIALYIAYSLLNDIKYNSTQFQQNGKLSEVEELKFWIYVSISFAIPSLLWQTNFLSSMYFLFAVSFLNKHPTFTTLGSIDFYFFIISLISMSIYLSYKLVLYLNLVNSKIEFGYIVSCYNSISWILVFSNYVSIFRLKFGTLLFVQLYETIIFYILAFVPALILKSRKE